MSIWGEQGYKDGKSDAKAGKNNARTLIGDLIDPTEAHREYTDSYDKGYEDGKEE